MFLFFFFNDTATTEIYTLSLHDALPILAGAAAVVAGDLLADRGTIQRAAARQQLLRGEQHAGRAEAALQRDRKSTRLNSSHANISYAVFCLKKKKNSKTLTPARR